MKAMQHGFDVLIPDKPGTTPVSSKSKRSLLAIMEATSATFRWPFVNSSEDRWPFRVFQPLDFIT